MAQYQRESKARKRAPIAAAIAAKVCLECGDPIAGAQRTTRKYCSQRCRNQVSLRIAADRRRLSVHKRRSLIRSTSFVVTDRDWRRLVNRHGGCCAYCGQRADLHMEHVVPLSRGGLHSVGNLLPACASCNHRKRTYFLSEWKRRSTFPKP